ncbi:hypothetical protein H0H87_006691 [Tephrocybe sp. NHM501043]|nr:hypothetical protein H0H87_006691 [Tephrocybe sp. NHM501043]
MAKVTLNGTTLAESTETVEHRMPLERVSRDAADVVLETRVDDVISGPRRIMTRQLTERLSKMWPGESD